MTRPLYLIALVALVGVVAPLTYCSVSNSRYERNFAGVPLGMSEQAVLNLMGQPDHRELPDNIYSRYASVRCQVPCHTRLWWESPLLPGVEAWSIEFDATGKVVHKAHWVSP